MVSWVLDFDEAAGLQLAPHFFLSDEDLRALVPRLMLLAAQEMCKRPCEAVSNVRRSFLVGRYISVLCDAQHIAIRVFKPGNKDAWRWRPYSDFVLGQARDPDELNAGSCQRLDRLFNVRDFPAKHSEWLWLEIPGR